MQSQPIPYEKTIFICEHTRDDGKACCGPGSAGFREYLKAYVKDHGLQRRVRVAKAGCLDQCAKGPNIFVFPDNVWYAATSRADLDAIIAQHLAPLG